MGRDCPWLSSVVCIYNISQVAIVASLRPTSEFTCSNDSLPPQRTLPCLLSFWVALSRGGGDLFSPGCRALWECLRFMPLGIPQPMRHGRQQAISQLPISPRDNLEASYPCSQKGPQQDRSLAAPCSNILMNTPPPCVRPGISSQINYLHPCSCLRVCV